MLRFKELNVEDATVTEKSKAKKISGELLFKFTPLFKKYVTLLKTGLINFADKEMKRFVYLFMDDKNLGMALRRRKQSAKFRNPILHKFNFVKETYGHLPAEEIMTDLQMLFLVLVNRYEPMGRNFCGYVYNAYAFEVSRHIKKFIKNPANIHYRTTQYEDYMQAYTEEVEERYEDKIYEDNMGIPDITWITGTTCSEEFAQLTVLERKLLLKYYMEEYNDKQIAEEFGMHINTVNQNRRKATEKLAKILGYSKNDIKRTRKTGANAINIATSM